MIAVFSFKKFKIDILEKSFTLFIKRENLITNKNIFIALSGLPKK